MGMTTESKPLTAPYLLVEEWVERAPLSWRQLAGTVSLALLSFLVLAAYLDGVLAEAVVSLGFWRSAGMFPAIIAYILLTQPAGKRFREEAITALRPLVPLDDDGFSQLLAEEPIFNRRRQWLAMAIGTGTVLLFRPWESMPSWLTVYQILAGAVMFGLLGWLVYTSLAATSLGTDWELSDDINVFELQRLEPIARWSLSNTLYYIGGITLSLLFIGRFSLDIGNAIIYGVLTAAAVLVFFTNMRSTHRLMVEAKNRELERVRENLAAASLALRERAATGKMEDIAVLRDYIETWVAYEERVQKVPEWPYTAEIRRNLLVSLLVPLAAYIVPALLLEAIRGLMSL